MNTSETITSAEMPAPAAPVSETAAASAHSSAQDTAVRPLLSAGRFWAVIALMFVALGLLWRRGDTDRVPPSRPLDQMPTTLDGRTSKDVPIEQSVLEILGKGVFLNRVYSADGQAVAAPVSGAPVPSSSAKLPVALFIGYFPTQRTGQSIHSPQNCLPGSGWVFESSGVTDLRGQGDHPYRVGEYVISDGRNKAEVLYWYQSHGRSIASDYTAKLYMLADSIRYNRTDAALVRIVTPLELGESREQAHNRAVGFAEQVAPLLPAYIPN